jgi:hypothetical protein
MKIINAKNITKSLFCLLTISLLVESCGGLNDYGKIIYTGYEQRYKNGQADGDQYYASYDYEEGASTFTVSSGGLTYTFSGSHPDRYNTSGFYNGTYSQGVASVAFAMGHMQLSYHATGDTIKAYLFQGSRSIEPEEYLKKSFQSQ